MQKWEYLTVACGYNLEKNFWAASFLNDVKIEPSKQISLKETLHQLGQEGWELVSEHVDPGNETFEYYTLPFGERMSPVKVGDKTYTKNQVGELIDELGRWRWELVDVFIYVGQGIFGKVEGIMYFKRRYETRVRRLQLKRPV